MIEEEAARLNHLVEQAMQMADLESHELKLDLRPHSMFEAVEMALETVRSQLRTHKVEIHLPSHCRWSRWTLSGLLRCCSI